MIVKAEPERLEADLRSVIRDVPDFPKPGITFKDITPLLADAALFARTMEAMAAPFQGAGVTHVAAIESRGFVFGGPIAITLGAGFVPIRKAGKLPWTTQAVEYALEYGTGTLEVHLDSCASDARVLLVDDVLATGGTALAGCALIEALGATVVGCGFLMALSFLPGMKALDGRRVETLVTY